MSNTPNSLTGKNKIRFHPLNGKHNRPSYRVATWYLRRLWKRESPVAPINIVKVKKKMKVLVTRPCPTLCDPVDCSPSGSSVHGILQVRIVELVVMPLSSGLS